MSRVISVKRRVVSYVDVDVEILEFLDSCGVELIPMMETMSLEIRIPSKCDSYTNYIGHINFGDLKYAVEHAVALIRDGKSHIVLQDHEGVIHLSDHLLTNSMVTIEK